MNVGAPESRVTLPKLAGTEVMSLIFSRALGA
jgi:hypothetical protein